VSQDQTRVIQISTGTLRVIGESAKKSLLRKILFQPILADVKKGEKLRISIAGSSWPAIGINPGQGQQPCGPPGAHCKVITMNLKLSGSNFQVLPLLS